MWLEKEFYDKIKKSMPIPCVDLIVKNSKGEILLLKRKNEPAKGQWWFPGGRVNFGETRRDTAIRKLYEECGFKSKNVKELKTYDVFLPYNKNEMSHAITTVFKFEETVDYIILDNQSEGYAWKLSFEWLNVLENKFLRSLIKQYCKLYNGRYEQF